MPVGHKSQAACEQIKMLASASASTSSGADVGVVDWGIILALLQDLLNGFCLKGKSPEAQQKVMRTFKNTVRATLIRRVQETQDVNRETSLVVADAVYQYGVDPANLAGLRAIAEGE